MNRSETIGKLATALAKAQGEMDNADKSETNPHFRSKYADLASVRAAIRGPFSRNGLAYVQLPRFNGEYVEVETVLMHAESGEFIGDTLSIPLFKRDAHGIGSATTYARRFSLMAIAGIAPEEDDDGNAASQRPVQVRSQPARAPVRDEPPIDEIPHTEPKEGPAQERPSQPATARVMDTGAAAVTEAAAPPPIRPPSRVDAIPTVTPTKATEPEWKQRERAQLSKGATDTLLGGTDGKGGLAFIRAGVGISTVEVSETQFAEWRKRADKSWKHIVDEDKERITVAVREFKNAHEAGKVEAAAISKGDGWDRATGELLDAAQ